VFLSLPIQLKKRLIVKYHFLLLLVCGISIKAMAQNTTAFWTPVSDTYIYQLGSPEIKTKTASYYQVDYHRLKEHLASAPAEHDGIQGQTISLPDPSGRLHEFAVTSYACAEAPFYVKFPGIQTFIGTSGDGSAIRADYTYKGFHATIHDINGGNWYIDPVFKGNMTLYQVYNKKDALPAGDIPWRCDVNDEVGVHDVLGDQILSAETRGDAILLRTYRLATSMVVQFSWLPVRW
jgi:hypothetical protein